MRARGLLALLLVTGCSERGPDGYGKVAEGIFAPLGEVLPSATPEQRATFQRGLETSQRRFEVSEGLGPAFNVTFCGACHERPTPGGSAGMYRTFEKGIPENVAGKAAQAWLDGPGDQQTLKIAPLKSI